MEQSVIDDRRAALAVRSGSGLDVEEEVLQAHAKLLGATIGIAETDLDGRFTRVNPTLCRMLGRPAHAILGRVCDEFARTGEVADRASIVRRLVHDEHHELERLVSVVRPDGRTIALRVQLKVMFDDDDAPTHVFAQVQELTGPAWPHARDVPVDPGVLLATRESLAERLHLHLARTTGRVGVVSLDVDHLRRVNDCFGYGVGDEALDEIARRLLAAAGPEDVVARSNGDEFLVMSADLDREIGGRGLADRLAQSFGAPFHIGGHEVFLTVSLGVAQRSAGATAEGLLHDAETAVSRAKGRGGARLEVFEEADRSVAAARLELVADLHRAIARQEFRVFYQPVVALATDTVVGFEALVRWEHPGRGLVGPGEFVPAAEEAGLIPVIGEWVLEESVRQIAVWRHELHEPDLWVAVNLSPRQLVDESCVRAVAAALQRTGVDPAALRLEVTETALMDDVERSIAILLQLKALGIHIAIDDFGTGYSSLSYLRRLPVDTLKIDRSFIDGLGTDDLDTSIVETIVTLGRRLHMELLAEGVETPAHLAEVRRLGCDLGQGFLWSRPLAPEQVTEWLAR